MQCFRCELINGFLHDLHNWKATKHMHRISILVANGGLWGNFTRIHWISQHLQYPIHLWNKINGQIMVNVGENTQNKILNIMYGNNHFEPT